MLPSPKGNYHTLQKMTKKYVGELVQIWLRIFPPEMVNTNLEKLIEHAKTFYEDLIQESLDKEETVKKAMINVHEEAKELSRLLGEEIKLPNVEELNVPLVVQQSLLDQKLTDFRESLQKRREHIDKILLERDVLCDAMDLTPQQLPNKPLPTENEISKFCEYLKELQEERAKRLKTVTSLRSDIKKDLASLEIKVTDGNEAYLLKSFNIKLNDKTIDDLQTMYRRYHSLVEALNDDIEKLKKKLEKLWNRLNIPMDEREKFRTCRNCSASTCMALHNEVRRLEQLKSENIKVFVRSAREEIAELWDKLLLTEAQRKNFNYFQSDLDTSDLLEIHDMELMDLRKTYEQNKILYERFAERKLLWQRMITLEGKATDPARLSNRGGQLLKEERERKMIAKKLPKIEEEIKKLAEDYEQRERKPFLVYGQNIVKVLADDWEHRNGKKQSGKIFHKPNSQRTPLSQKNGPMPTIKRSKSATTLINYPVNRTPKVQRCDTYIIKSVLPKCKNKENMLPSKM